MRRFYRISFFNSIFFIETETAVRKKYDKNMMMYQTEIKK